MNLLNADESPIIACSTGLSSNTAIALIRISGFNSLKEFRDIFSINVDEIKPRFAHYCSILDGDTEIDDIVLLYFKGPNSYNGENILELNVHGNQVNIRKIMDLFISKKLAREAYAGEFSYRALKNGKLSVSEVEGLEMLLNASSEFALSQGKSLLNGELRTAYKALHESFINHKGAIELSIDFLEDIGEEMSDSQVDETFQILKNAVSFLHDRVISSRGSLLNPKIVIAGIPNSGKSTLFNSLLKKNRAIVSNAPGTTRDYISEMVVIDNTQFELIDTAGIRETIDEVEKQGIDSSFAQLDDAFYRILIINPFLQSPDYEHLDIESFDNILFSHEDQPGFKQAKDLFEKIHGPMGAEFINAGSIEPSMISAIYGGTVPI